jgi:hypothetical protein
MNINKKIDALEAKLADLQDLLDKKDNNPIESNRIRNEIKKIVAAIQHEKDKQPVDAVTAAKWFDDMRRALDVDEHISVKEYKNFF